MPALTAARTDRRTCIESGYMPQPRLQSTWIYRSINGWPHLQLGWIYRSMAGLTCSSTGCIIIVTLASCRANVPLLLSLKTTGSHQGGELWIKDSA